MWAFFWCTLRVNFYLILAFGAAVAAIKGDVPIWLPAILVLLILIVVADTRRLVRRANRTHHR